MDNVNYPHAPIVEAELSFGFDELSIEGAERFTNDFVVGRDGFDEVGRVVEYEMTPVADENGGVPSMTHQVSVVGFGVRTEDKVHQLTIANQSLTVVQRCKYENWESFTQFAMRWYDLLVTELRPARLIQVSVRFTNDLPVPDASIEISDYVRLSVDIPAKLPQATSAMSSSVEIPFPEDDAVTEVRVSTTTSSSSRTYPGVELSVSTRIGLDAPVDDEAKIKHSLDRLRAIKNLVFEACITDATRMNMERGDHDVAAG